MAVVKCVLCFQQFSDGVAAKQAPCKGNGGHVLQEVADGSWNDETRERADFIAAGPDDLKRWAEQARKLGYTNED